MTTLQPKLRFPEFSNLGNESYKKHSFKDVFLFSTGKNIKQNEASPEFETPCVRYGELYHMYKEVITEVKNRTNFDKSELLFSDGDEILLPSAGEDPLDIGSASALTVPNVAIGRTINILKPLKANIYSQIYVAYYINQKLRKNISTLAKGVSISNVYNSDLKTLDIILPKLSEQTKIANFLTAIDEKLQALQQKKSLLEQYKKGTMQQIFSQELRFKQDDGADFPDWEEKSVGDFAPLQRGFDLPVEKIVEGNFPVVFSNGILKKHNEYKAKAPGVVTGRSGTIGKVTYVEVDYWPHNTALWVTTFKDNYPKFVFYFYINFKLERLGTGSGVPTLNRNDVHIQRILVPNFTEQIKIADFLSDIDEKINKVTQQIEATQTYKKGLLQQMFC